MKYIDDFGTEYNITETREIGSRRIFYHVECTKTKTKESVMWPITGAIVGKWMFIGEEVFTFHINTNMFPDKVYNNLQLL